VISPGEAGPSETEPIGAGSIIPKLHRAELLKEITRVEAKVASAKVQLGMLYPGMSQEATPHERGTGSALADIRETIKTSQIMADRLNADFKARYSPEKAPLMATPSSTSPKAGEREKPKYSRQILSTIRKYADPNQRLDILHDELLSLMRTWNNLNFEDKEMKNLIDEYRQAIREQEVESARSGRK
jgi:hypothetical protein